MSDSQRKWFRLYFLVSAVVGASWASEYLDVVFQLGNNLILLGFLGLLWIPISGIAFLVFLRFKRFLFALSPLSFLVAFFIHFFLSPDNKFSASLDQSTIFSITFGITFCIVNLSTWWLIRPKKVSNTETSES